MKTDSILFKLKEKCKKEDLNFYEDKTIQIFFGSVGESWVRTSEIRAYNS